MSVEFLLHLGADLFEKRESLLSMWQDIAENFYPERADFTMKRRLGQELAPGLSSSTPLLVRRELGNAIGTMLRPTNKSWMHPRVEKYEKKNPGFGAVDLEVRRGGRSYTIDTLRALAGRRPGERELFFLIGMDALAEIRTWHEADRLAEAAHFAVFPRPGHPFEDPRRHPPAAWGLGAERRLPGGLRAWRTAAGTRVWLVPTEVLSISASAIRARAARGASIRYLVPAAVERAISRGGLYRRGTTRGRSDAPRQTKGA